MAACAICKCVQCVWASPSVPKGRSAWAKTIFFLHQLSINEPIYFIRIFKFLVRLFLCNSVFQPCIQRWQYEKLGISKHQTFNLLQRLFIVNSFIFTTFCPIFYIACYTQMVLINLVNCKFITSEVVVVNIKIVFVVLRLTFITWQVVWIYCN